MRRLALVLLGALLVTACGDPPPPPELPTTVAESTTTRPPPAALMPTLYECVATESIADRIDGTFGPGGVVVEAPTPAARGELEITVDSLELFRADASDGLVPTIDDLIESLEVADQRISDGIPFTEAITPVLDRSAIARVEVVKTACEDVAEPVPIMVEHTNPNPMWAVLDFTFEEPIQFDPEMPLYRFDVYFDADGSYVVGTNPRDEEGYISFRSTEEQLSIDIVAQTGVSRAIVAASGDNDIGDVEEWMQWTLDDTRLRMEILQPIVEDDPMTIIVITRATWSAADAFPAVGEWVETFDLTDGG